MFRLGCVGFGLGIDGVVCDRDMEEQQRIMGKGGKARDRPRRMSQVFSLGRFIFALTKKK